MSEAYCRLRAALDELHAVSRACLESNSGSLREALVAATARSERAYAAWIGSGEQATAQQEMELLAEFSEINRLTLLAQEQLEFMEVLKPLADTPLNSRLA